MAFANAKIGLFVGAGGGGLITVSDDQANGAAAVANASYWNQTETDRAVQRRRQAVVDFIELQQDGTPGATGAGVPMLITTRTGTQATKPYKATITAAGPTGRVNVT